MRARHPRSKMCLCEVRKPFDEYWAAVQTFHSLDGISVAALTNDFDIELIERFNVVRGECNGNENQVLLALFNVVFHRVRRLGSQPRLWADLRLPA